MTVKDTARQLKVYNDVLKFKQAFVGSLARASGGTYNPVTETTSGATTTNYPFAGVFVKASKNEAIPADFVISNVDNQVIVFAGKGVVPNKADVLTILSEKYAVLGAVESSGGDDALFRVYLKKGAA